MESEWATFDDWRRALLVELRRYHIDPRDAARLGDELEIHYEDATEARERDGTDRRLASREVLAGLGAPAVIAKVARSEHLSVSSPIPLLVGHALAPVIVIVLLICAASVATAVQVCGDDCDPAGLGWAALVLASVLLVPPILAGLTMAKAKRALLSETWGWVAAGALSLAAGILDLQLKIDWPRDVEVGVTLTANPSLISFAIPLAVAALVAFGMRTYARIAYTRLARFDE